MSDTQEAKRCPRCKSKLAYATKKPVGTKTARKGKSSVKIVSCHGCGYTYPDGME